jgi:hypothetical protein
MPKLPTKTQKALGPDYRGLQCKNPHCRMGMALGGDLEDLPSSFEATCPVCHETRTYQKDEIQSLVAVRKQ